MIASLEGTLAQIAPDRVVVSVGGVGYEAFVSRTTLAALPRAGRPVRLYTHLHVRDDALTLFGFADPDERSMFLLLLGVTGIGPKVALAMLSVLVPDTLRLAIVAGDQDALTMVPGIGKKVAARVVLEMKDRLGAFDGDGVLPTAGPLGEVREALIALGLSPQEAREAVAALPPDGARPVEDLLRDALRVVGRP